MGILKEVSEMFSVDVEQPPATEEEIMELKYFSPIEIPSDYLDLVREATEVEIKVKDTMYIRIWSPSGCKELNEAYCVEEFMPNSLVIGDDEGGKALVYINGNDGFGLYIVGFGNLGVDDAIKIASSLRDLLVNNIGVDKLFDY